MNEYLTKVFEAIHLSPRHLFGISVLGLFLLFAPEEILTMFGVKLIIDEYRSIIGIITLFGIFFYIIQLMPLLKVMYINYKRNKIVLKYLESLSRKEALTLMYCLNNNQNTLSLPITHSTANALVSKGIMKRAGGTGNSTAWPYTVSDFVWKELKKNKKPLLDDVSDDEMRRFSHKLFDTFYN